MQREISNNANVVSLTGQLMSKSLYLKFAGFHGMNKRGLSPGAVVPHPGFDLLLCLRGFRMTKENGVQ